MSVLPQYCQYSRQELVRRLRMVSRNVVIGVLQGHCRHGVILILSVCLCYTMNTNYDLSNRLREEREKNQKYRELNRNCDQDLASLKSDSLIKDNKTATLWSNIGKLEIQIQQCRDQKDQSGGCSTVSS